MKKMAPINSEYTRLFRDQQKGIFSVSFDFELAWGNFDRVGIKRLERKSRITRERVIPRLIEMLESHRVSATWATVGHLMLERCNGHHGEGWPEGEWANRWFQCDPRGSEHDHPEWYACTLVRELAAMEPTQDIGLHGFSHCVWGEATCSREVARAEMRSGLEASAALGIRPRSFVFPRNSINHLPVLVEAGIEVFRGEHENWYRRFSPGPRRFCHLLSQLFSLTPEPVEPHFVEEMVCVPFSGSFMSMDGLRRCVPVNARVRRAKKGMRESVRRGRVFHLSTHPINLAYDDGRTDGLLEGLDRIFEYAVRLRSGGHQDILNLAQIADLMGRSRSIGPFTTPSKLNSSHP